MKKLQRSAASLLLVLVMLTSCVVPSFALSIKYTVPDIPDEVEAAFAVLMEVEGLVADNTGKYTLYSDIKYCKYAGTEYDLYIPKDLKKSDNQHLILLLHSGSYTSGDKDQQQMFAQYFAAKGYIVGNLNYTLKGRSDIDSTIALMDNEVKLCVKHIKNKCKKLGYKISGMAPAGYSAGGGLALLYADRHRTDSPIPIKFVFEGSAVTSFRFDDWEATASSKAGYTEWVTGKTPTDQQVANGTADKWCAAYSPIDQVTKKSVPHLMIHGKLDRIVNTRMALEYRSVLKKKGVKYDFLYCPHSGHILVEDPDYILEYFDLVNEYCETYFND